MGTLRPNRGSDNARDELKRELRAAQMGSRVADMDSITYSNAVARNVKAAIDRSGLTLVSVAQDTGIARATLQRRLDCIGSFTVREIKALADLLDTTAQDLTTVPVTQVAA